MIDVKVIRLQLKHAWTISRNSSQFKDNVFVSLERDGITGLGEAAPNVRYGESAKNTVELIKQSKKLIENADWPDLPIIKKLLDSNISNQSCAKAALDMAILDWNSKLKNLTLRKFLELQFKNIPPTSFSIGIDSEKVIRQKIEEAKDFPILKIKLGTENDKAIMKTIRNITDKPIRVDANEGWKNKSEALEKIHWLQEQNVEFVEQPMPAAMIKETAWLREKSNLPIIADEAVKTATDISKLVHVYDGINIKLMKSGGIQESLQMIRVARSYDLKIMLGCMIESSLAISAAAQLAPLADWLDLDGNLLIENDPYSGIKVTNGYLQLNDRPGLGVEFNF